MSATDPQRTTERTIDLTKEMSRTGGAAEQPTDSLGERLIGAGICGDRIVQSDAGGRLPHGALLVKGILGKGARGEVYEVCPNDNRRKRFALKVPLLPLEQNASGIRNEIAKLTKLRGTHLPKLLMHGEFELDGLQVPYYVTHLLQPIEAAYPAYGKTRQMHAIRALEVTYALAQTLSDLAQANVVHNDFKLENVMFFDTLPLLVDWGTAKFSGEINEIEAARKAGKLHGTPSWLPPEVIRVEVGDDGISRVLLDLDGISQFTDVYGLGLMLMLLLTGLELFEGVPLGSGVLDMFKDIHEQFHQRDLLGKYRRSCKKSLERLYLATDSLSLDRIRDEDLATLYDISPSDGMQAVAEQTTLWRRLTRKIGGAPAPTPRRKLDGLALREQLIKDVLSLHDDCVAPIDPDAPRRRLHASTLVDKMRKTWPGLPLWYEGRGYMALPTLDL